MTSSPAAPHPSLAALAASPGGAFTALQARAVAGYSEGQARHFVRTGQWVAVRHGVYADSRLLEACGDGDERRHAISVAAALLALSGTSHPTPEPRIRNVCGAAGGHHSAARVLGLDLLDQPSVITVIRPSDVSGSNRSQLRGVLLRQAALPARHVSVRHGVWVTTPARTVVDLARTLPFVEAVVATDAALRGRLTSQPELRNILSACRQWPGIRQAARVVEFADPWAESAFESVARVVFADHDLPPPQTQVPIIHAARIVARVDFYWERYRTIAEADGLLKYTGPDVLRAEKLRQERLADLGYEIVRITWRQITQQPDETVARIGRAFARARVKGVKGSGTAP